MVTAAEVVWGDALTIAFVVVVIMFLALGCLFFWRNR